ncbi:MAG: CmcI family methyltransferase [Sphingomonadaceae bacterium]
MRITLDSATRTFEVDDSGTLSHHDLFSKEAFAILSDLWVRLGWVQKYSYGFTWLGRPIIQMPEDMVRLQEAIVATQPDIIIETGIAHGGSVVFCASICEMLGKGQVIGIDVEIRFHNREAIEAHPMVKRITMIEGSSIDPVIVSQVRSMVSPSQRVLLILDSNHSRAHVEAELEAYSDLVAPGGLILVQDGVMQLVAGMPRTGGDWVTNNPISAIKAFLDRHPEFEACGPPRPFDETLGTPDNSHHPSGWLRRRT